MRIIYFTTAMSNDAYNAFIYQTKNYPNPSNQSFHNKLIHALAITYEVEVISFSSSPFIEEKEGNIHWNYINGKGTRHKKINEIMKCIGLTKKTHHQYIIFADTINLSCLYFARNTARKFHTKSIGIVTDNPNNITNANYVYKKASLFLGSKFDAYYTLTTSLNSLFNKKNKPHIVVEGIVDDRQIKNVEINYRDYFFFGGALLPQYGIYNLIKAYNKLENCRKKLVICGHHYNESTIKAMIKNNPNIAFLKTISIDEARMYERNAFAIINPRPLNWNIDLFSIPSKTIDSLNSGRLTICVHNPILEKYFYDSAIWAPTGEVNDLYEALKSALSLSTYNYNMIVQNGKTKIERMFSLKSVNIKVKTLIDLFN